MNLKTIGLALLYLILAAIIILAIQLWVTRTIIDNSYTVNAGQEVGQ
jgi:hypothetical protein